MCSYKIADGAQYAHSVPNTYVHHIAHTTANTPCATIVSVKRSSSNRVQTETIYILHCDIKQHQASSPYLNACNPHACNPLLLLTSQPTYLQQHSDAPTNASAQAGHNSPKTGGRLPCRAPGTTEAKHTTTASEPVLANSGCIYFTSHGEQDMNIHIM